ncbi:MAG: hypothetical protein A2750_01605 [Candidatus Yanofskybacteria bacterium RIFCSPHIGHO2_01_FULL_45_42]|uniref:TraC-like domain-containing protein n=2 Tax=Candidatus Yanofskyibacteriota TaxID=1752733 RepID=A0A1F8H2Y8_9BACT|nr:MAG: hypothetical protein A2750_01605 [Candidatus Yanofskybacteria bacterium RIFCSPHIGHO2_01_FULL_45_42]OGN26642.1 MAG: hypothetical protein A3B17_00560 [Candidatus Yanofskybacteria bacterium RIFCSPLOWO2_01_FULL_45_72]OGN31985.1 MAG: hypothetical protein A3J01_02825 [Candidatus Yanofskybacteria bacterium RIFCSPLOWO2_02_FULL_45_18]
MPDKSTINLVEISDIRDGVAILKDGSLRAVVDVGAINFELRSEDEQTAIIQNFQNFLNSLDFPLQIVITSRHLDIENYLKLVESSRASLTNELLKIQAAEYGNFVKEISSLANIMDKQFYVVVPFYAVATQEKGGLFGRLSGLFKKSPTQIQIDPQKFGSYRIQLLQRVELILDGLTGMGLKSQIMESEELIKLFCNLYNPPPESSAVAAENQTAT